MLKMVALLMNDSQNFLKSGSAVWEKTMPDTKGLLKCFVKHKITGGPDVVCHLDT